MQAKNEPNLNIIVIEGHSSSGKTTLLKKIQEKFPKEQIAVQDLDSINTLTCSGPYSCETPLKQKIVDTHKNIDRLIATSISDKKKILVISGISIWDKHDFFSAEHYQYPLKKIWYDVHPVEVLVRGIFRFDGEATDANKQALINYFKLNIHRPFQDIDLSNVVSDKQSRDISFHLGIMLLNYMTKHEIQIDAIYALSLDALFKGNLLGISPRGMSREDVLAYGYAPYTEEQIYGEITKALPVLKAETGSLTAALNNGLHLFAPRAERADTATYTTAPSTP
jgi:hypothetical protein